MLNAGCRWISVREKDLPAAEQAALTRELLAIARDFGAVLTLHGNAALARASGADGVHLSAGGDMTAARAALGSTALVGISIHGDANSSAPSIRPSSIMRLQVRCMRPPSKPGYGPALGSEGLRALVGQARDPGDRHCRNRTG